MEIAAYGIIALAILAGMLRATGKWVAGKPEWMYYTRLVDQKLLDAMGPDKPIFGYLPGFKALLIPFVATEPAGFFVFLLLNALSCAGTLWLVFTHFTARRGDAVAFLWLALCSAVPVWFVLQNNQLVGPAVFLTLLAFLAMRKGREWSAGLLIALAILVKTLPLPLLAFPLVRRQWRTVMTAMIAAPVLSVALAALTDGLDASVASHIRWPAQVMAQNPEKLIVEKTEPSSFYSNQSASAELIRLASAFDLVQLVWLPKVVAGVSLLILIAFSAKRREEDAVFWSCVAGWFAWVAFAAPFGRYYYLLFIVPAVYRIGLSVFAHFPDGRNLWLVALCIVSLSLLGARGHNPLYALATSVSLFLHLFLQARFVMKNANKSVDHYGSRAADGG